MKTICFTGHRPGRLPAQDTPLFEQLRNDMGDAIIRAYNSGFHNFISGMARGVDLMAARNVVILKPTHHYMTLTAAVPFRDQYTRWLGFEQEEYLALLPQCDRMEITGKEYYPGVYIERDKWMVDNSDAVIAVWDGHKQGGTWATMAYAQEQGKRIYLILIQKRDGRPVALRAGWVPKGRVL